MTLLLLGSPAWAGKGSQIQIDYRAPKMLEAQEIYREMRARRVLEGLREIVSMVRLPRPLTLRLSECGGEINAWYAPESRSITVCYEYIQDMEDRAQKARLAAGTSHHDAIVGPIAQVFLHETGHALFHLLDVPVLGREGYAADPFAILVVLRLKPAQTRQIIDDSAILFTSYGVEEKLDKDTFSDDHGLFHQRLYNLLCLAYGSDERAFAYLVERGDLPKERAETCRDEYGLAAHAMAKLFQRHLHGDWMDRVRVRRGFRWIY